MTWPGWQDYDPTLPKLKLPAKRRSKYGAQPTEVDGIRFDSKREADRWQELQQMEAARLISDLDRQVTFGLNVTSPAGAVVRVADYRMDFVYREKGRLIYEDCKGYRHNAVSVLKRRWFEAQYGTTIRIS